MLPVRRADRLRTVASAAALLCLAGCVTTGSFRSGERAERAQDYDRAVVEYTKAAREHPNDANVRVALERARLRAAQDHFSRGRRLSALERYEEAVIEFQLAAELNPTDALAQTELKDTRQKLRTKLAVSREGRTELQAIIERSRNLPPVGMELPSDVKLPESMTFGRGANSRAIFSALARFADVNIVFDPGFRDAPLAIDLRNATLEEALTALTGSTQTFYKVTAPRTITIIPDTQAKRREYEEAMVQVFHLSNADIKEVTDLLRIVIDIRQISPMTATNSLAIKDTPERIAAAGRLIAAIDKARPEVMIEVELLEVDRTRLREYGLQIASPGSPGISGAADVNRAGFTLQNLRNLTQADVLMSGIPGVYYRLLKNDTNTRTLASPHLRTPDGLAAQAKFGERVPIPVTTFAPIATGGINQQPITSFVYENIGVNIDITPRLHHNDDVSLSLKISLSSISGEGFGGLPTFGNREINTTIRLKDGETNMLAGLIRDDERTVLSGVPGLSDLPLIGRLFANHRKQTQQTDILLTLTPHIVRVLELSESDLRPFKLGRDSGGGVGIEVPQFPMPPRDEPILPGMEKPPVPPAPAAMPFPQPLQGPLPGKPVTLPKKPGGGGLSEPPDSRFSVPGSE
ncbi:MAG TPA: secretin N-terminal domain-containing protein [Vicinamibacterales bacterium]|nr:secretin N-terminal domain-containing protein [Vicinamibacterales bacterium]